LFSSSSLLLYLQYVADRPAIFAGIGLALTLVILLFQSTRKPWLAHIQRKRLLTPNEIEFFFRLQRALPSHHIFTQVSFAAFLTDDGKLSKKSSWAVRTKFDRKIADYVVCDQNFSIVALVELDDRTHVASADRHRDALTRAAGYQTLRFQSKQKPSVAEIAELFRHAGAWTSNHAIR
jgi:hypothetical protein